MDVWSMGGHVGIFTFLGVLWKMLRGHIQRVDAHFKLNGYSVDVKKDK